METFSCRHCARVCKNKNSLSNHERLCKENPNRDTLPAKSEAWLAAMAKRRGIFNRNQFTKAKELGLPKPVVSQETRDKISVKVTGIHPSEETRKKISETQKENYRGKSRWFVQGRSSQSYAEGYFQRVFEEHLGEQPVNNLKANRFWLDFAWERKKAYVEIDGEQHYTPDGLKHDADRATVLSADGWVCVRRVRWSEYKKLSSEDQRIFIQGLIADINSVIL